MFELITDFAYNVAVGLLYVTAAIVVGYVASLGVKAIKKMLED